MEYRMKYRDVPWLVAFTLLPGKIIGTFIIKPFLTVKKDWQRLLLKWLHIIMGLLMVAVCVTVISLVIDHFTGGEFYGWLNHIWHGIQPKPEIIAP